MEDPVTHVRRPAAPWRPSAPDLDLTECGRPLADVPAQYLTSREELVRYVKEVGKQRAAFTTCMTCADTIDRHESWDLNPVAVMGRDGLPSHRWGGRPTPRQQRARLEMFALALLVEAHRDEFDQALAGLQAAEEAGQQLVAARATRRAKARREQGLRPL